MRKRPWPAAVFFDDRVNLFHEADGVAQGGDDLVVVEDIVGTEVSALAVLEPLLADLVAADVELPHLFRNPFEADALGLVEPDGLPGVGNLLDFEGGDLADELRSLSTPLRQVLSEISVT